MINLFNSYRHIPKWVLPSRRLIKMTKEEEEIEKNNDITQKEANPSENIEQDTSKTQEQILEQQTVKEEEERELDIEFSTTAELPTPTRVVDQVIGQDHAVNIIKKAAVQRRNVLLIGEPGTGKSMLGLALAELLPTEELVDVLAFPNPSDENTPHIRSVKTGEAKKIINFYATRAQKSQGFKNLMAILLPAIVIIIGILEGELLFGIFVAVIVFFVIAHLRTTGEKLVPKLLVDNSPRKTAPFYDATGAHAGALLGDVRHDPFQSGGLGTPAHQRVEAGLIHKANKGVLFIDEVATLSTKTQHDLLTAMQEKRFHITGQSELSSGAMVRTEEVPCDFVLVAAGNLPTIERMHPALRSRIRGYGYEIYMNHEILDTPENRKKLARFVAQEIVKDGRIPHFTYDAVEEIIKEARRRAGRKGHLTLKLRDLGGLIRAAGDIAREEKAGFVKAEHVRKSQFLARTLENQVSDEMVERRKDYKMIETEGLKVGRVNGLAVVGERSGIVMPIEAEVAPSLSQREGRVIATGMLRMIAREAVQNVSALIKKYAGEDIHKYDVHIQFIGSYGGVEGDSASISVATAIISAMEGVPIRQDTAMTGSLSVRGTVLPVGGVVAKIEAAIEAGLMRVIVPETNMGDTEALSRNRRARVEIIPASTIVDVLEHAVDERYKDKVIEKFKGAIESKFLTEIPVIEKEKIKIAGEGINPSGTGLGV